jgi:hypothetical protein
VSISLSSDYYYTLKAPVKIINFPEGYSSGSKLPEYISIKLKGKGWNILPLTMKGNLKYLVSAGSEPGNKILYMQNSISENGWASSDVQVIGFKPDTISCFIEKIAQKTVKIVPDVKMDFADKYGLASPVTVYPESTIVYGPRSYMKSLNEVYTNSVYYSKLDRKIAERIQLRDKDGFYFRDNSVLITVDAQLIVEKNFDNVLVEIKNVPKGESVMLIPNYITIGLRGGVDILGKIKPENLRPYVRYEDIKKENSEVIVPKFNPGPDITVLYIKPTELRYIIKKF